MCVVRCVMCVVRLCVVLIVVGCVLDACRVFVRCLVCDDAPFVVRCCLLCVVCCVWCLDCCVICVCCLHVVRCVFVLPLC